MWLLRYITNHSLAAPGAVRGDFRGSAAVDAAGEHKDLSLCAPYGFFSLPPGGESAVVLPLEDGEVCLGVVGSADGLEEGELMLRSKGGASLVLKNDGRVLVNGRELVV